MVLDVAQLEALLTRTFSIGLDVGRGREKVALVRLRLSRALLGGPPRRRRWPPGPWLSSEAWRRSRSRELVKFSV